MALVIVTIIQYSKYRKKPRRERHHNGGGKGST